MAEQDSNLFALCIEGRRRLVQQQNPARKQCKCVHSGPFISSCGQIVIQHSPYSFSGKSDRRQTYKLLAKLFFKLQGDKETEAMQL
jgi:hypothetical protein